MLIKEFFEFLVLLNRTSESMHFLVGTLTFYEVFDVFDFCFSTFMWGEGGMVAVGMGLYGFRG